MALPGAHVGKAELLQKLSDIARVKVDAEPLSDDALEVDPPPPHDAVPLTIRPGRDDLRQVLSAIRDHPAAMVLLDDSFSKGLQVVGESVRSIRSEPRDGEGRAS